MCDNEQNVLSHKWVVPNGKRTFIADAGNCKVDILL